MISPTLRTDTRGMSQAAAVGLLLGTAFVLALAVGVFMLFGGS